MCCRTDNTNINKSSAFPTRGTKRCCSSYKLFPTYPNVSALQEWTVIKQTACDDSALAFAVTQGHFAAGAAQRWCRNEAGREQRAAEAHGARAPLRREGLQMFLSVLSRLKGAVSDGGSSPQHAADRDVTCCTEQWMMATRAEVRVLAQVASARPPKSCLAAAVRGSSACWANGSVY